MVAAAALEPAEVRRWLAGLAATGFYAAYVVQVVRAGKTENALWACQLGCLLVGAGWLGRSPVWNAVGVLWLLPGLIFWLIYLIGGGAFKWTSCLTHVGGNSLGLWGAATLGLPEGAWWKAGLGFAVLLAVSSRISRPSENVNFSRQVWPGWEQRFPSYRRYVAGLLMGAPVLFLALELLLRQLLSAATGP